MSIAAQCVHGVGLCVVPKPENNFRPLALRHRPLALVSTALIAAKILAVLVIGLTPASAELSTITAARIVQLTNAERASRGFATLAVSPELASAAQQKAQHMLDEDYFAHISPSGVTPWFWMNKVGYRYQVAGENLAIDFVEAEDVVAAWLASPSHRDNMLHDAYSQTGVAVATGEFQGGTSTVVVHMFGLPAGSPSLPPTPAPAPPPTVKADTNVPTPTPTPSPSPVPTAVPDTTPPRVPRIALASAASTVTDHVTLLLEGDAGDTVTVLINGQEQTAVTLPTDGQTTHVLSLFDTPDGTVIVNAYSLDPAGNQSTSSAPLELIKDTTGPEVASDALVFVVGPATDRPHVLLKTVVPDSTLEITSASGPVATFGDQQPAVWALGATPFTLTWRDTIGNAGTAHAIALAPDFAIDHDFASLTPPASLARNARLMAAGVFMVILVLLSLAILIRFRIQRPALIAHATFVLLVATAVILL